MLTAIILGLVSGVSTAIMSRRYEEQNAAEFDMALALSAGDFSKSVMHAGEPTRLMQALAQIAERELDRETNQALRSQDAGLCQSQLAETLDLVPQEVATYNREGLLVLANKAFLANCNQMGAVIALGMTWHEVMTSIATAPGLNLPSNERQSWIAHRQTLRDEALASQMPVRFARDNGSQGELMVAKTATGNRIEIVRDVHALAELEQRIQHAEREVIAAARIKQVTISRLSHTIRTPMTGVLAASELMAATDLDKSQRERLEIIRRSASTLLGVVQDMIDMAQDPGDLAQSNVLEPERRKKTAIVLEHPESAMDSAVEALTHEGYEVAKAESIELLREALKVMAGQGRLPQLIQVLDAAAKDQLYAEIDGLALVKELKVEVATTLPEPSRQSANTDARPIDIIVAESDEVRRIAYENALAVSGHSYRVVATASETLALIAERNPKLVFVDITLPDMNGLQLAEQVRSLANGKDLPRLVAMTEHFVNGDRVKCLSADFNHYMLKPAVGEELVACIESRLEESSMKLAG